MLIHRLTADEALVSLRSAPEGLTETEAARRLREHGPNHIGVARREGAALLLARELTALFSLVLWVAAALAFALEYQSPGEGMARLGCALIAVIVVSALFSYWQEFRAERTLAVLSKLLPARVLVMRAGLVRELDAVALVPGDIVWLHAGDNVPADCRAIEAHTARVDNATLTGEALPQACSAQPSAAQDSARAANLLLAGTTLVAGKVRAVVFATGVHTALGRISRLTHESSDAPSPLRVQIAHLSRVIVTASLGLGALFFTAAWLAGIPLWQDFILTIGIIVAMVPEGLLPTLTLSLVLASQRMAERNVLIRHLPAVEALGSVTVICTDKTGTLTQNSMAVRALSLGASPETNESAALDRTIVARHREFFLAAALCNEVSEGEREGRRALLGDPMEVALVELAGRALPGERSGPRIKDIPFDAQRMRLTTVHASALGPVLYCKGAPESVLPLCTRIAADGAVHVLSDDEREAIARTQARMAQRGLRVLAFAYRRDVAVDDDADLERDLVYCGLAGLEDPPRPEVAAAVRQCREAGIRVIMVTGDNPDTAAAIAREIGLLTSPHPAIITGEAIRRLSDVELQLALDAPDVIFARAAPDQKHRIVEALKRKREIVAVTGDGVNDAPALKSAHVGIAMGIGGTDVARAAADIVLLDDNFASIVDGISRGRAVFDNIRKFLTYILAHNVPELVPYLGFALGGIPLALTPMQILAIDMGTDSLSALGLGAEKPEPGIMQRPPRRADERLFDLSVAVRAYLVLGLIEATGIMCIFFYALARGGWRYGAELASDSPLYLEATTACLVGVVAMQSVNVFVCRSSRRSALAMGWRGNPLILAGVALGASLAFAIAVTPLGNAFFGTAPIAPDQWLLALPFAAALLAVDAAQKAFGRSSMEKSRGLRTSREHAAGSDPRESAPGEAPEGAGARLRTDPPGRSERRQLS